MGLFDKILKIVNQEEKKRKEEEEERRREEEEKKREEERRREEEKKREEEEKKRIEADIKTQKKIDEMTYDEAMNIYAGWFEGKYEPTLRFRAIQILTGLSPDLKIDAAAEWLRDCDDGPDLRKKNYDEVEYDSIPAEYFYLLKGWEAIKAGELLEESELVDICRFLEEKGMTASDYASNPAGSGAIYRYLVFLHNAGVKRFNREKDYYVAVPGFFNTDFHFTAKVCILITHKAHTDNPEVCVESLIEDGKFLPPGRDHESKVRKLKTIWNIIEQWPEFEIE